MRGKDQNIRKARPDEERSRAFLFAFCALVMILCVLLDVYFVMGIFF